MLWEGSRMFLPEHREQLQAMRKENRSEKLFELAEDRIEELNWSLQEALHYESPIILDYVDGEQFASFCGFIEEVNTHKGYLNMVNGKEKRRISLTNLYRVTLL